MKSKNLKDISKKLSKKGVNLDSKTIRKLRESKLTVGQFKLRYGIS